MPNNLMLISVQSVKINSICRKITIINAAENFIHTFSFTYDIFRVCILKITLVTNFMQKIYRNGNQLLNIF